MTAAIIGRQGIYDISEAVYHADPCSDPSLSSSIAKRLVRESPLHAWAAHPRLGCHTPIHDSKMDDGSILHKLLLGRGAEIHVMRATYGAKHERAGEAVTDYKTKAAQDERDEAYAAGLLPVLPHRLAELRRIVEAVKPQIKAFADARHLFGPGVAERAMIWNEGDVWMRALIDWMPEDTRSPMLDIKTTAMSAAPGAWERRLISDYAFQAAFYERGFRAVHGVEPPPMLFVVIEMEPPYGVSVMAAAPALRALAEAEVEQAVALWRRCMETAQWPGYPPHVAYIDAPPWMLGKADEAALRREFLEAAE